MDGNAVANSAKQYIILKFDNEQYGIDITYIDNIVRLQKITRVPHAQPYFLGIINLRGEVVPVMNAKIGILVDEVREVVTLTDDDIEQIATESGDTRTYLTGVGKYNESLISLLNIGALIADIDNE